LSVKIAESGRFFAVTIYWFGQHHWRHWLWCYFHAPRFV